MQKKNLIFNVTKISYFFSRYKKVTMLLSLLLAGSLHGLSFSQNPMPSWSLGIIQICSLSWLMHITVNAPSGRYAFVRALLFSGFNFCTALYWISISLYEYGEFGKFVSACCVLVLSLFLGLYYSSACWLSYFLSERNSKEIRCFLFFIRVITWAAAWSIFEWIRGTLFTGFPWANIAFAHAFSPLSNWAPILGIYGVDFIVALCAAFLSNIYTLQKDSIQKTCFSIFALCLIFLISWICGFIEWSKNDEKMIDIYLVQSNISQLEKLNLKKMEEHISNWIQETCSLIEERENNISWIIFPETILAESQEQISAETWSRWSKTLSKENITIILGIPLNHQSLKHSYYTNSVITLNASTSPSDIIKIHGINKYDKKHLVPFGEFTPKGLGWLRSMFEFPLGDFIPGKESQELFLVNEVNLVINICYENLFPKELLLTLRRSAASKEKIYGDIILNISNLAWFGNASALGQHIQISQLLAIQLARPLLSCSNTGITAFVDSHGSIISQLKSNQYGILKTQVQSMKGINPYIIFGDYPIIVFMVLVLLANFLFSFLLLIKKRTSNKYII